MSQRSGRCHTGGTSVPWKEKPTSIATRWHTCLASGPSWRSTARARQSSRRPILWDLCELVRTGPIDEALKDGL